MTQKKNIAVVRQKSHSNTGATPCGDHNGVEYRKNETVGPDFRTLSGTSDSIDVFVGISGLMS
ncbi:MAG: hypothetical protein MK110_09100 [Fuerstiella sp.]|nr:hypothetical protein [Fuerstiella sp.]